MSNTRKKTGYLKYTSFTALTFAICFFSLGMHDNTQAQNINLHKYSKKITTNISYSLSTDFKSFLKKGKINKISFSEPSKIRSFYRATNYKKIWVGNTDNNSKAKQAIEILEESWTHGFNPEKYNITKIKNLSESIISRDEELELLLTDAVIKYIHDLSSMRIPAKAIGQNDKFWRKKIATSKILKDISTKKDIKTYLNNSAPNTRLYNKLRNELISHTIQFYMQDGDTDIKEISFNGILRPGDSHKSIPAIRKRVKITEQPDGFKKYKYDDQLALKLMKFQKQNNLNQDAVIGYETLRLLNRSVKDRIIQIIANMERIRWLDTKRPDRYIVVNIPSMTLWAIDNGKVEIEMPVIVGQKTRKTQSFITEIEGIRVNPTWTVPYSIKKRDFIPKLQKNPLYLAEKDISIYKGYGKSRIEIDPTSIDWNNVSGKELIKLRMIQSPGDHNALGRLRILMQNDYDIYLHDTNDKTLFSKNDRFLSSGCIRLSDPDKIANFIMSKNKDWSPEKLDTIKDNKKMKNIKSQENLPVYILYQSIWLDETGKIIFGRDIYSNDKKLYNALLNRNEVTPPKITISADEILYAYYQ